uniref:Innexin n=1 Tax=Panagrolaimus sp. PS1159 TaxID=55785 RepID=A0AC35F030_9BILA
MCYVENKYFIPPNQTAFPLDSSGRSVSIDYYPWILVLFIIQAIFFVLPHWIWESLNSKTGIPLRSLAIGLTVNHVKAKKVYGKRTFGLDFSRPTPLPIFCDVLKFNLARKDKIFWFLSPKTYVSSIDSRRLKFVERLLYPHKSNTYPHKYGKKDENIEHFVHKVLGKDGVITLRILFANLTQYKVSAFTKALFESCKNLPIKKKEDAEKVDEP